MITTAAFPFERMARRWFLVACGLGGGAGWAAATTLPAGYVESSVVSGVGGVTAIAWSPTGDLWITGKNGEVWVQRGGSLSQITSLPVSTDGERGIGNLAIDPDYATNRLVWIYYTAAAPAPHNRLSRFTDAGSQLLDEDVVMEGPALKNIIHNGGGLAFGLDGTIYLSIGDDDQRSVTAQDPHDRRGKVLHLNRDGSPAVFNPYLDGSAGDPLVWALGFRNPFRLGVQAGSGTVFIGDVGADKFEELDLWLGGGNYGWDHIEGPQPPGLTGYVYPVYSYAHDSTVGNAIIAGGFVPAGNFPPDHVGNYFFADEAAGRIYRMQLDTSNQPTQTDIWATDVLTPTYLAFGPDGALYYTSFSGAEVRRISYTGSLVPQPQAVATATPDNGKSPLTVHFDASGSSDPAGTGLLYAWDFGDGSGSTSAQTSHSYPSGAYAAGLTVTSGAGLSASAPPIPIVSGNVKPLALIEAPANESHYVPNTTVAFSGLGYDGEDKWEDCSHFEWRVLLHHVPPGGTVGHIHPWLGPLAGVCKGSFEAASHEDDNVYYEIILNVTDSGKPLGDSGKLTGTRSIVIRPNHPTTIKAPPSTNPTH